MADFEIPKLHKPEKTGKKDVLLIANGDLRLSANQKCWPAQQEMEAALQHGRRQLRLSVGARASNEGRTGPWIYQLAAGRHGCLCRNRS